MQPSAQAAANPLQRWVQWLPLWLGVGVSCFFLLPYHPSHTVSLVLLPALGLNWHFRHHKYLFVVSLALSVVALGYSAGIWQTKRAEAPVLSAPLGIRDVSGRIREIAFDGARQRLTLDQLIIDGLAPERTPERIRISATLNGQSFAVGQWVEMRANLSPPARPVIPGGFDFGRYFYFRGIGGIGYAIPPVLPMATQKNAVASSTPWNDWMAEHRLYLKQYFMRRLPAPANALAVAYVTGDQSSITDEIQQNMRVAGLSHILAISGMHMTLVCGLLYYLIRLVLVAAPLSMRIDIRKPAALIALLSGIFYLWLADFPISAVRAYVMIALVFTAILLGRETDALRSLVLAATLILLVQPSSLLEPGFQLSFAAVLALILYYRWWSRRHDREYWEYVRWPRRIADYLFGIAMTSLVAGVATAPLAAYHFHQFSSYGLLANLAAIPLVTFWVTPALMLALLLSPFQLDPIFLEAVGEGFNLMVHIADLVAAWPGALLHLAPISSAATFVMIFGGLILLYPKRIWRLTGGGVIVGALLSSVWYQTPDLLISGDARAIAWNTSEGWRLLRGTARSFSVREWQLALDTQMLPHASPPCDLSGCLIRGKKSVIALPRYPRAWAEDCILADVVISDVKLPANCRAKKIDSAALSKNGTHALWFTEEGLHIENGCQGAIKRPWNRCRAN